MHCWGCTDFWTSLEKLLGASFDLTMTSPFGSFDAEDWGLGWDQPSDHVSQDRALTLVALDSMAASAHADGRLVVAAEVRHCRL